MAKIGRNAPCPCGSGKKYKKCCLLRRELEALEQRKILEQNPGKAFFEIDDLDDLSNSVFDLIDAGKFDEAESVCIELKKRYPDQVDGIERMAMVYEARGETQKELWGQILISDDKLTISNSCASNASWPVHAA